MRKINLQNIRDILVIVSIYLFFSGWVYVYYFYEYFGVTFSTLKIDYTSFLVYSFNVLTSFYYLPILLILALILIYYYQLRNNNSVLIIIFTALLLFPALYCLAKYIAGKDANYIRNTANIRREVQFIFRDDSGPLSFHQNADSLITKNSLMKEDVQFIKYPDKNHMRLLGESDNYFIVLNQPPVSKNIKVLSIGSVYFIDKKDVLLTKITIR